MNKYVKPNDYQRVLLEYKKVIYPEEWISVKDSIPLKTGQYIAAFDLELTRKPLYFSYENIVEFYSKSTEEDDNFSWFINPTGCQEWKEVTELVTHWAHIPEPEIYIENELSRDLVFSSICDQCIEKFINCFSLYSTDECFPDDYEMVYVIEDSFYRDLYDMKIPPIGYIACHISDESISDEKSGWYRFVDGCLTKISEEIRFWMPVSNSECVDI